MWLLRVVVRRAVSQRLILAVVALIAVGAATTLTTLAVLGVSAERWGIRAALSQQPADQTQVRVHLNLAGKPLQPVVTKLEGLRDSIFADVPTATTATFSSQVYEWPRTSANHALIYFGSRDGLTGHARILSGRWPLADNGRVEVAVPKIASTELGIAIGDTFTVGSAFAKAESTATVVGLYGIDDPESTYWSTDVLDGAGVNHHYPLPYSFGWAFTDAYGPFLTTPAAMLSGAARPDDVWWTVHPSFDGFTTSQLGPLTDRTGVLANGVATTLAGMTTSHFVFTNLPGTLGSVERSLQVMRSGVVITSLLLLVLAVAALLLTTRLLAERRVTEQALMRARGLSTRQLTQLAFAEGLGLAAMTTVAAPFLARLLYGVATSSAVFGRAGLQHDPGLPAASWIASGAASAILVAVLLAPLARRSGTFVENEQEIGRQRARTVVQRSGLDIALILLAALGYRQLRQYDSPLVSGSGSHLSLDPILVAGPALCLLAGGLLVLRLLPPAAKLSEFLAARGRRLAPALAGWQIGRRPLRSAGSVLLLTLAIAVGTFGLSYLSTWRASQADQAAFQAGTDVRVSFPVDPPLGEAGKLAAVPGATRLMPVTYRSMSLSSGGLNGEQSWPVTLIAADTTDLPGMLHVRGDVLGRPADTLFPPLAAASTASAPAVVLPGRPERLSARVTISQSERGALPVDTELTLVVQDATGARAPVAMGSIPDDGKPHVVDADLAAAVGTGRGAYPWRIVAVQAVVGIAQDRAAPGQDPSVESTIHTVVDDLMTSDDAAGELTTAVSVGADTAWSAHVVALRRLSWSDGARRGPNAVRHATRGGSVLLDSDMLGSGGALSASPLSISYTPWDDTPSPGAVVTTGLLHDMDASVGQTLDLAFDQVMVPVTITAAVPHLPTVAADRPALVVDRDLLSRYLINAGYPASVVDQWWASVPDDRVGAYLGSIEAHGMGDAVSRVRLTDQLRDDPLRIGIQAALFLVIGAAAVLAAIGFAVHATVAFRLRRTEFAQLRALGLSRRSLTGVVGLEYLLLGLLGVGGGLGLGALLAWSVGPIVAVSATGGKPVPAVLVHVPWLDVGQLAAEIVVLLAVVIGGVLVALRRSGLGSSLRLGDER